MFQFVGYNFCLDGDALNKAPSLVNNIETIKLSNAIIDHFNVTRNINQAFDTTIPTLWDYDTIINADFNNELVGGNVGFLASQISAVKIKRRIKGNFDWLTLKEIKINKPEDLSFVFNDRTNANDTLYEYAFVPIVSDIETDYIINEVFSKFKGVFIGGADDIFRLLYDVNYSNNSRNQQIGVFQPLGKQFPVIVANGKLSYESGSVSATILNDDYEETRKIDRKAIVEKKNQLKDFLTDKKPKILKDWNGNIWLCIVDNNIDVSYLNGSGMGIPRIGFSWTEIGEADNQQDLYNNGLIDTLG